MSDTAASAADPHTGLEPVVTSRPQRLRLWCAGVGLSSMRERAEELGGLLTAAPSPDGGRVLARLPLMRAVSRVGGP